MRKLALTLALAVAAIAAADVDDTAVDLALYSGIPSSELLERGKACVEREMWDSAFVCYSAVASRGIDGASAAEVACITRAYNNLGYVYLYANHDSKKAFGHFLNAKALAEKYNLREFLGFIYLNISYIHYYDRLSGGSLPGEMIECLQAAFEIGYQEQNHKLLIHALASLIEAAIDLRDTSCVVGQLAAFAGVDIPDSTDLRQYIGLMTDAMDAYIKRDYPLAAEHFMEASQNVVVEIGAYQYEIDAMLCAAEVLAQEEGSLPQAGQTLQRALTVAVANSSKPFETAICSKLARVYQLRGNEQSYRDFDYRYLSLKDSLASTAKIGRALEAQFEFSMSRASEQIKALGERQRRQTALLAVAITVVAVVLALLCFVLRSRKRISESNRHLYRQNLELLKLVNSKPAATPKYRQSPLSQDDTQRLFESVTALMETSQEIFKTDFNLERLSELLGSRSRLVSQAINECGGTNFNGLVNRYRIMEACRLLNDPDISGSLTIEAIAERVGFKSRTGFSTIFKGFTGLSPAVYQRMASQNRQ